MKPKSVFHQFITELNGIKTCQFCGIRFSRNITRTLNHFKNKCQKFPLDLKISLNIPITKETIDEEIDEKLIISETDSINDRNFFINLVKSCDERLSFVAEKGKSEVWNRFERIYYDNCETLYVKCKYCDNIQKHLTSGGTGGLINHRCKPFLKNNKSIHQNNQFIAKPKFKKRVINEKLSIEKLSHQNKTLKLIVEKCIKMIDKCLCFNKYNSDQRKEINDLVNEYNEGLFEFKDYNLLVDKSYKSSEDSDYDMNERSDHFSSDGHESDTKSDNDSQYKPHFSNKNSLKLNSIRNVNKLQIIRNNMKQKVTNAIKRKYKKRVERERDPNERAVCKWPGCEQVFKFRQQLKVHRDRVHLGIKNWRCDWPGCEDCFEQKSQLNAHISKYHTNEKRFKCDQCSYTTPYKYHILRHKRIHTNEKPFVCDWPGCEYKSNFDNGLKAHKFIHSGLKPHKCSWPSCEWSFSRTDNLKVHMLKHTGEKPVLCQFNGCDRRFSTRQAMRFHVQRAHQNSK